MSSFNFNFFVARETRESQSDAETQAVAFQDMVGVSNDVIKRPTMSVVLTSSQPFRRSRNGSGNICQT